ncbi:MAG: hypothetical protein OEW15_17170 [Nitrospirota bacterium]|nr:hypothetical protein [Nitrospirota bacterium]
METFEIDLAITSQSKEYAGVSTDRLEAEGFYGQFRIRVGNKSYGYFDKEIATQMHPQDDLYYWIKALLKTAVHLSEVKYFVIRDIEHPARWIEFVDDGRFAKVSVIDAVGSSDLIVTKPFKEKKTVIELGSIDKTQMINNILDAANNFIENVMNIEPRFAHVQQHKDIADLIAVAKR